MNIDELKNDIFSTATKFSFIKETHLINETDSAIKFRLEIDIATFIQTYHNIRTGTINYILILGNQRIYGRDCCEGKWHRHPFENPSSHDFSAVDAKPATLYDFLKEVEEYLVVKGLI